jgi:hypothetical protein
MLRQLKIVGLLVVLIPTLAVHLVACGVMKVTLGVRNWAEKCIA